jgi:hypothetical protein
MRRLALRVAGIAGLGALVAGAVIAQPSSPETTAPAAPAAEEAPPATVAPPAPAAPAPVAADEVSPASAPKAVVAEPARTAEPMRRPRYDIAVLQALDKITAETLRFEAKVGVPVRWKGLVFTVQACERSAPDEPGEDAFVHLSIDSQPRAQPGRPTPAPKEAFRGWMFAASPGLHPVEHPVYDAWAITCRASAPAPRVATAAPARPPSARPPEPPAAKVEAPAPAPTTSPPPPAPKATESTPPPAETP